MRINGTKVCYSFPLMLPRWVVVSATRSECIAMDGPEEDTQWAKTEKIVP